MKRIRSTGALVLALALVAAPVSAQDATQQAKVFFNAGAQAYEAAQYPAAIQAFTEAYRLSPRPGILFSMAQAHRKQYTVDKQAAHAREAVKLYREYVSKVEQGGRRADAVQALAELDPIVEKLGAETAAPPSPAEAKATTRLMVTAQTKEATIALDGGKATEAPLYAEVKPGKHTVRVTAPGYFPEEREVQAAEGGIVGIDVPMREQPGLLTLATRDGADVSIDGRIAATTPLSRPVELTPGRHFVAVTKRGYHAFSEDLEIGRGETRSVTVPLEVTGQRVSAYVLVGVAAAGVVAGGVLTGLAVYEQGQAQTLSTKRTTQGGLSGGDLTQYDNDVASRDTLRTSAGVAFGGAFLVGATALVLVLTDQPVVGPSAGRADTSKPAAPPPRERSLEVSAAPLLAPGFYGASLRGRF